MAEKVSPGDALLLKAAFGADEEAVAAWRVCAADARLDSIGPESYYVLPQLYCHLADMDHPEPGWAKIKGIFRKTWYHNQITLTLAARLMAALRSEGVETLLLGDAALAAAIDPDVGRRPIDLIVILVHPNQVENAARLLHGLGWQSTTRMRTTRQYVQANHRHRFGNGRNQFLQLQWRIAPGQKDDSLDRMWLRSIDLTVNATPICVLAPTDQLLHLLALRVTGEGNSTVSLHRFATIWRSAAAQIDWPELFRMASEERLLAPLYDLFQQATAIWAIDIPPSIAQTLLAVCIPWGQRVEFDLWSREHTLWNRLLLVWLSYVRATRPPSLLHALKCFPRYMQQRWPFAIRHPGPEEKPVPRG